MLPGGPTEIIAHFAGYLRLLDTVVLHREIYDGDAHVVTEPWSVGPHREAPPSNDLDEMPSRPLAATAAPPDALRHGGMRFKPAKPEEPPKFEPAATPVGVDPLAHMRPGAGGGGGGGGHGSEADRLVVPDQELIQIRQINALHDADTILMVEGTGAGGTEVEHLHGDEPALAAARLLGEARAALPEDLLPRGTGTGDQIALVQGRDLYQRDMSRPGEEASSHDASSHDASGREAPGREGSTALDGVTIDGVHQPDGTAMPAMTSPIPAAAVASHNGLVDPGLEATTGGNQSLNYAGILDNHTQHRALIVGGDAFTTQAIVQVNVLTSDVDIAVGGRSGVLDLVTDGDVTRNAARFTQHDTDSGAVTHLALGTRTQIDVISGDFYDVKSVAQVNMLSDNDVVVQGTFGTYYTAVAGANTQVNLFSLEELGSRYDLIVVKGDYHTFDMVYQTNVLLNDAVVKAYSARVDTLHQTIVSGDNVLENIASVDQYGTRDFRTLSADQVAAIDSLDANHLDPSLAALLPRAESSTLHVLYVTGDFYKLNVISQTNIVSNIDTAIQYLPDPGTTTGPTGDTTHSTQSVTTGANHLSNVAAIAAVGTTSASRFVGGEHYDDAILVQANYVSQSTRVTIGDTQSLASEVAAFTGLHDVALPDTGAQDLSSPAFHGGGSSLTHDLLHGMMA